MMPLRDRLVIVHGGQTGVDRGAHFGAIDARHRIAGYMPRDRSDEQGLIPDDVAKYLKPALHPGYGTRTLINIDICHAVLVIVADPTLPYATPGTTLTLKRARQEGKRALVVGPGEVARATDWLFCRFDNRPAGPFYLMVAGPRASRWADGENVAFEIVSSLPSGELP